MKLLLLFSSTLLAFTGFGLITRGAPVTGTATLLFTFVLTLWALRYRDRCLRTNVHARIRRLAERQDHLYETACALQDEIMRLPVGSDYRQQLIDEHATLCRRTALIHRAAERMAAKL